MRRVGQLFEQVTEFHTLRQAARRAARGKRLSREAAAFLAELEQEVLRLQRELLEGRYRPRPYRTFTIEDPKPRTISAAAFRDRVVHHALCASLEPTLERVASPDSFACRRGRGTLAALRRAQQHSRRWPWYLKLDVRHFFETVEHAVLRRQLARLFKDARLLRLIDVFLDAGAPGSPPGCGLPIGNLTSQYFANLYLTPLDHLIKDQLRVPGYCRYMDDLLLFAADADQLRIVEQQVERCCEEELRLTLRPERRVLAPVHVGIPFLGFRLWPRLIRLDARRVRRVRRHYRALLHQQAAGQLGAGELERRTQSRFAWIGQADTRHWRCSWLARLAQDGYHAVGPGER